MLVTTTIAAMSAISEIGGPAAPICSVMRATNVREASGVMMSNVSAAPGRRWRRARIDVRACASASSTATPPAPAANT